MSNAKHGPVTPWKIPLSELFILLGFVLLVSAGIVTVVLPELQDEPKAKSSGSQVQANKDSNQARKR